MKKRVLSWVLVLVMLVSIFAGTDVSFAATSARVENAHEILLNPLYEDIRSDEESAALVEKLEELSTQDTPQAQTSDKLLASGTYSKMADAAEYIREEMVDRERQIVLSVDYELVEASIWDPFQAAMEYFEDCSGQEGDALLWNYDGAGVSYRIYGSTVSITYDIIYRTTAAQEAELTKAVNTALKEMNLSGKSEFQKVRAIYQYICDNVDYDYEHLNAEQAGEIVYPLMYTAYAAMCDGTAVCQGYAILFYRMCKDVDLSVRLISGYGNGGRHGWNIVRIGDVYYNMDSTWDGQDEATNYNFFVKCEDDFGYHFRDSEYDTEAFHKQFPMASDSWEDYSQLTTEEGLNLENIFECDYNNIDGGVVSNYPNGKPKVLVFGNVGCPNTQATISSLSKESFDNMDVIYVDAKKNSAESVSAFRDSYGSENDDIIYTYNPLGSKLGYYIDYLNGGGTIYFPYIVYIDADNMIQYQESGRYYSGREIKRKAHVYGGTEALMSISKSSVSLSTGAKLDLDVEIYGMESNSQFFTWTSSNKNVATVDANGTIKAIAPGTATITCRANDNVYRTCKVTVAYKDATPQLASVKNAAGVKFSWKAVAGAEKYRVYRKEGAGKWVKLADTKRTSYTDTKAKSGVKYSYTVQCINASGNITSDYNKTGLSITYMAAPTMKTLSYDNNKLNVKWNAVDNASHYLIKVKKPDNTWTSAAKVTGTSYNVSISKTGKYTVYVYAVHKGGTQSVACSKNNEITVVSKPAIKNIEGGSEGVKLSWNAVKGVSKYRIYRKTDSGKWEKLVDTKSISYVDKTAKAGVKYSYSIRCFTADGKGFVSDYDKTGKSITYVKAPKISKLHVQASGIQLSWSKAKGAVYYRIYRQTGSGDWEKIATTTKNAYVDKTAKVGKTYKYRIRCISKDKKVYTSGYGSTSTIKYLKTPKIANVKSASSGVNITWKKISGAEKYVVYRKTASGDWEKIATTSKNSYTDKTAKNGKKYYYTVRCISEDGKSYTSYYDTKGTYIKYKK